ALFGHTAFVRSQSMRPRLRSNEHIASMHGSRRWAYSMDNAARLGEQHEGSAMNLEASD
ncbi:hypothetical protein Dimus_005300, partial [Dionaea muscipula]